MRTLEEVSFAENRMIGVLHDIKFRQDEQTRIQESFAANKDYNGAAECRARVTGLMMAENLIREELMSLEVIRQAVVATRT